MSSPIPILQRRESYLGCVDATISVDGRMFAISLDVFGHITPASAGSSSEPAEPRRAVIDRVMFESHEISVALPVKALDAIAEQILREVPQ